MTQPRRQTLAAIFAFCLALAAVFFFSTRAIRTARRVRWQNEPIRSWMSVPFVAHTHHIPEAPLFAAIHLPLNPRDHRPIRQIAREEHVPPAELIRDLQKALDQAPK